MNPVADGECRYPDCPDCESGRGHPPMLAVYDSEAGEYALTEDEICTARRHREGAGYDEGDICGNPASKWAGYIPLCGRHYKRFKEWVAAKDDLVLEREARLHEQHLRHREELMRQSVRLELKYAAALSEAKAASSVVYYIRRLADGMIKIGYSASPPSRLSAHRREQGPIQVLLVLGGGRVEENAAHGKFREYQIGRAEWFRPARPLLEWIRDAREGHTHPGVQPDDILPLDELGELIAAAVPKEDLRFDEGGRVLWPPTAAVA